MDIQTSSLYVYRKLKNRKKVVTQHKILHVTFIHFMKKVLRNVQITVVIVINEHKGQCLSLSHDMGGEIRVFSNLNLH